MRSRVAPPFAHNVTSQVPLASRIADLRIGRTEHDRCFQGERQHRLGLG